MTPQRDWLDKDFYEVLGVPSNATTADIKQAYRKLAQTQHPDANPDNANAEERFKAISEAYAVLGSEDKRKEYDELRRLGASGAFSQGPRGGGSAYYGAADGDLSDLLRGMFGGGSGFGGFGTARSRRKGADLEAAIRLSFEDALSGLVTTLRVSSDGPCDTCQGSGARPGTSPRTCDRCGGSGAVAVDQGMFSLSQPCPTCSGRGQVVDDPCGTCGGSGRQTKPREIRVRIPAGVRDGAVIRIPGKGGPGTNGGPPGDLFVRVTVAAHRLFGRSGEHVTLEVPITYAEAALGTRLRVPTPSGDPATIRVPAGTASGTTLRVRGRGGSGKRGTTDLLVTLRIAVPTKLSRREKQVLEELARVEDRSDRDRALGVVPAASTEPVDTPEPSEQSA